MRTRKWVKVFPISYYLLLCEAPLKLVRRSWPSCAARTREEVPRVNFMCLFAICFFFSLSSKTASLPIRHFSRFARVDGRVQLRWRGCVLCVVFFTFLSTCKFFFFTFCILHFVSFSPSYPRGSNIFYFHGFLGTLRTGPEVRERAGKTRTLRVAGARFCRFSRLPYD